MLHYDAASPKLTSTHPGIGQLRAADRLRYVPAGAAPDHADDVLRGVRSRQGEESHVRALLAHGGDDAAQVGRAIREACLEAVASGARTADLGGHLGTAEFTDEVIGRVRAKLEIWASL